MNISVRVLSVAWLRAAAAPSVCAAVLCAGLVGCDREHDVLKPMPQVLEAKPSTQGVSADNSVPDASAVFAAKDAADKARGALDTAALQQAAAPQKAMTKEEESKAMPLPGQVNDHSTTAPDKKKGK